MNPSLAAQLQLLLALVLGAPFLSALASSVAGILAQDGWDEGRNGTIAWSVLLLAAAGTMFLAHQLTLSSGLSGLITAIEGAYSLLLSGSLHSLKPWTDGYLPYLRSHVFSIVKAPNPLLAITAVRPAVRPTMTSNAVAPMPLRQRASLTQPQTPPQDDQGG